MRMKLSEAIRLGAMLRPQGFGAVFYSDGGVMKSCALGAAGEAVGVMRGELYRSPADQEWAELQKFFPILLSIPQWPCEHKGFWAGVSSAIGHLNDTHRWTREQIADWVEGIECQQEATAQECTPVEVMA